MKAMIASILLSTIFTLTVSAQELNREAALLFNEGVVEFKSKNYEGAIDAYSKALAIDKNYFKARYSRAKSYLRVNEYKKAISDFNHVIKADPTNLPAFKYKGYAYMQLKKYHEAVYNYTEALKLDPEQHDLRTNKAIALLKLKDYPLAKKELKYLIDNGQGDEGTLYNLSICEMQMKHFGAAADIYEQLIAADYKVAQVSRERARLYINQKKFDAAIPDLNKVIQEGTNDCEMYYLRGYSKLKTGDIEGADGDFKKAISLNAEHRPSIQNKAFTSYTLEKYEEAIIDFTHVLELTPNDKKTRLNRGLSALKIKDYQSAYKDFSTVIEQDPAYATAYYNRASAAVGLEKQQEACADMREAAKLGYEDAFNHIRSLCGDN